MQIRSVTLILNHKILFFLFSPPKNAKITFLTKKNISHHLIINHLYIFATDDRIELYF